MLPYPMKIVLKCALANESATSIAHRLVLVSAAIFQRVSSRFAVLAHRPSSIESLPSPSAHRPAPIVTSPRRTRWRPRRRSRRCPTVRRCRCRGSASWMRLQRATCAWAPTVRCCTTTRIDPVTKKKVDEPENKDRYKYWPKNRARFPAHAFGATLALCSPASTLANESSLSIAAYIMNKLRSRLGDATHELLTLAKINIELCMHQGERRAAGTCGRGPRLPRHGQA